MKKITALLVLVGLAAVPAFAHDNALGIMKHRGEVWLLAKLAKIHENWRVAYPPCLAHLPTTQWGCIYSKGRHITMPIPKLE